VGRGRLKNEQLPSLVIRSQCCKCDFCSTSHVSVNYSELRVSQLNTIVNSFLELSTVPSLFNDFQKGAIMYCVRYASK